MLFSCRFGVCFFPLFLLEYIWMLWHVPCLRYLPFFKIVAHGIYGGTQHGVIIKSLLRIVNLIKEKTFRVNKLPVIKRKSPYSSPHQRQQVAWVHYSKGARHGEITMKIGRPFIKSLSSFISPGFIASSLLLHEWWAIWEQKRDVGNGWGYVYVETIKCIVAPFSSEKCLQLKYNTGNANMIRHHNVLLLLWPSSLSLLFRIIHKLFQHLQKVL